MGFPKSSRTIVDRLGQISYAEIEDFFLELRRRQILTGDLDGKDDSLVSRVLVNWEKRARATQGE
jgi:hypothetical protein